MAKIQPLLAYAAAHLDEDISLAVLAARVGLSRFHVHREFRAAVGETPKQLAMRLRLERAAVLLLTSGDSILRVALDCGFHSHESFCRAFHRYFRMAPGAYRKRGFAHGVQGSGVQASALAGNHAAVVKQAGPCIGLFRRSEVKNKTMTYSIEKKLLAPQPVLLTRRRVKPGDIAPVLAKAFHEVFLCAQRHGIALAGQPFTRYLEWGPGLWTIEAGLPVAAPGDLSGEADVLAATLPGGWVATATHSGPYDKLTEAHAAIQVWIEEQGFAPAAPPWEVYVTDPADYPDVNDWKTDLFWPLDR